MADPQGFSHITVTAADDDDIVIQAGIVEAAEPEPEPEPEVEFEPEQEPEPEPEPEAELESDVRQGPGGASHSEEDARGEAEEEPAEMRHPSGALSHDEAAPSDGYHETTLADLESVKMSRAQKAVIVVALLGIVAFVAWYLLAH
ncbi:SURF2 Surfeit locus protein 2 [uncultured Adlercreutzia sp.]|uniref:SURF2 Surfeit locus protein 2 n=1 Tax=uncultured Adlercreutzia sp. TaxID=875803 RepID=UPI0026F3831A|nr:SURF2 Surfeit locus protein 2 [uncultured Adlercreutzia sp.]